MRTTDVALPAVAIGADTGSGRPPLPQDGPPFGDLLSLMGGSGRPAMDGAALPPDGRDVQATSAAPQESPQDTPEAAPQAAPEAATDMAANLDRLILRCIRPAPRSTERRDSAAASGAPAQRAEEVAARPDTTLRLDMAPRPDRVPADEATTGVEEELLPAAATDSPAARPQPAPLPAIPPAPAPAPLAEPRAAPAPATTVAPRANPVPVPGAAETGATDAPEPMRLAVLRQETHFAPVRSFTEAAPLLPATLRRGADPEGAPAAPQAATAAPDITAAENPAPGMGRPEDPAPPRGAARLRDDIPQERSGGPRARSGPVTSAAATARAVPQSAPAEAGGAPPEIKAVPAPVLPFASLAQVGHAIAAEAAQIDPASAAVAAPGARDAADSPARAGPVRVLDIALAPEALGRVVVHMRLTSQGLTVRLKADNPATAELLAGDRDHLAAILRSAGLADVDLEVGGPGLSMLDAPVRSLAQPEGAQGREAGDHEGGSHGGADPGRQGRNSRQDRTYPDDDSAPSFADEPRAGAG